MEVRNAPRIVTTKRSISYRRSSWRVHEMEVCSGGETVCRAGAVRVRGALLVWAGAAAGPPRLGAIALALPAPPPHGAGALATPLIGEGTVAPALAQRLAARLQRPVYVCCGDVFDRFTLPLVERGLLAEIKSRPDIFES